MEFCSKELSIEAVARSFHDVCVCVGVDYNNCCVPQRDHVDLCCGQLPERYHR